MRSSTDAAYLLMQLRKTRDTAAQQLRLGFKRHGWDVSAIGDHEIGKALLEAAIPGTHSSRDLFGRAFERLGEPRRSSAVGKQAVGLERGRDRRQ